VPSDPTRRDVLARARDVRSELESSPTVRGFLAGTLSAGIAKGAGGSWRGAVGLGVMIGARRRALMAGEQRVLREVRNAADAATLAAWLGELTPPLGTWAIEPDFARLIAAELTRAPETVVECGSGTTTLLIGRLLKQNAHGRLVSLEHDRAFADRTRNLVRRAHLEDVCEVVWAPLRRQLVRGETVTWYDPDRVGALSDSIDLLVVDGPPAVVPWARWPALAVLAGALPSGGTVLLDDGRRADERRTARRWRAEYPEFELYWHDTVKGSWRLVKADRPPTQAAAVSAYQRVRRLLNPHPTGFGRWPVQR
jgi:predicted O-methyltransferase YrrM